MDSNTMLHLSLAAGFTFIAALIWGTYAASFLALTNIITLEACQAEYLRRHEYKIRVWPIIWDIGTGIVGAVVGCVLSEWAKVLI